MEIYTQRRARDRIEPEGVLRECVAGHGRADHEDSCGKTDPECTGYTFYRLAIGDFLEEGDTR